MRRTLALAAALAALAGPAAGQVTTPGLPMVPLGYCQLTSIDASTLISSCPGGIPAGTNYALLVAEAQAIRYRDDNVAPTATVGMPVPVASTFLYAGTMSQLRVISQVAGAKLNILFYRSP